MGLWAAGLCLAPGLRAETEGFRVDQFTQSPYSILTSPIPMQQGSAVTQTFVPKANRVDYATVRFIRTCTRIQPNTTPPPAITVRLRAGSPTGAIIAEGTAEVKEDGNAYTGSIGFGSPEAALYFDAYQAVATFAGGVTVTPNQVYALEFVVDSPIGPDCDGFQFLTLPGGEYFSGQASTPNPKDLAVDLVFSEGYLISPSSPSTAPGTLAVAHDNDTGSVGVIPIYTSPPSFGLTPGLVLEDGYTRFSATPRVLTENSVDLQPILELTGETPLPTPQQHTISYREVYRFDALDEFYEFPVDFRLQLCGDYAFNGIEAPGSAIIRLVINGTPYEASRPLLEEGFFELVLNHREIVTDGEELTVEVFMSIDSSGGAELIRDTKFQLNVNPPRHVGIKRASIFDSAIPDRAGVHTTNTTGTVFGESFPGFERYGFRSLVYPGDSWGSYGLPGTQFVGQEGTWLNARNRYSVNLVPETSRVGASASTGLNDTWVTSELDARISVSDIQSISDTTALNRRATTFNETYLNDWLRAETTAVELYTGVRLHLTGRTRISSMFTSEVVENPVPLFVQAGYSQTFLLQTLREKITSTDSYGFSANYNLTDFLGPSLELYTADSVTVLDEEPDEEGYYNWTIPIQITNGTDTYLRASTSTQLDLYFSNAPQAYQDARNGLPSSETTYLAAQATIEHELTGITMLTDLEGNELPLESLSIESASGFNYLTGEATPTYLHFMPADETGMVLDGEAQGLIYAEHHPWLYSHTDRRWYFDTQEIRDALGLTIIMGEDGEWRARFMPTMHPLSPELQNWEYNLGTQTWRDLRK